MRRLVLSSLLLLLIPAVPAKAADAVPDPTVTVRTTWAAGSFPYKGLVSAHWDASSRGKLGTIIVSGNPVAGTRTTVDALWTSKDIAVSPEYPSLAFQNDQLKHKGNPPGSCSVSYGWRMRTAGGRWGAWHDTAFELPGNIDVQAGETRIAGRASRSKYQFQWHLHVDVSDTSQIGFNWAVRVNG